MRLVHACTEILLLSQVSPFADMSAQYQAQATNSLTMRPVVYWVASGPSYPFYCCCDASGRLTA
jgi:hypothetical protein